MKRLSKFWWVSLIIFVVIIVGICILLFFNSKKLVVKIKKNLNVEINSKLYNTDKIKSINNGNILTKKKVVNTSNLGNQTISLRIKNFFFLLIVYKYKVNIVDTIKPKIIADDNISVVAGNDVDLLSNVKVQDNSLENIIAQVVGDYDLNIPGNYDLEYVAVDSSGNKETKKFVLNVQERKQATSEQANSSFVTSKGFHGVIRDGITYIDGILIANKTYALPSSYYVGGLTSEFNDAFNKMVHDASNDGLSIYVVSGFRSYNTQKNLYNNYVTRDGVDAADTYSARAGHSEHQTGLAADFNMVDDNFEYTAEGKWLNDNAYKYGFILRYPKGKTFETGYIYESWHYRYVGVELSRKLYNNGDWISLENYFGITSQY